MYGKERRRIRVRGKIVERSFMVQVQCRDGLHKSESE